jgi:uncharacterized protein YjbI with pentapeptide repeats
LSCIRSQGTGGCNFPDGTTQFKGANLQYAYLENVGLVEADLENTDFGHAFLIGADLNFANLMGANLASAQLGVAPGSGVKAATLSNAFMINVDLTSADLRSVDFHGAHIYGAATDALFVGAQLDSADFTDAILSGAVFSGSLTSAVFDGAQLVNATFNGATLTNAKFTNAYLQGADFSTAETVTGMNLSNAAVSTNLTSTKCTLIPPGAWTYTEQDGVPYTYSYGETKLKSDGTVTCPDNHIGNCTSGDSLCPIEMGPFPPVPACAPSPEFCWENCYNPPCFDDVPDQNGICPFGPSNCPPTPTRTPAPTKTPAQGS